MKLCDILKMNMQHSNLPSYKVANDLGISTSAVTAYVKGNRFPSIKVILGMRHVYGWSELDPYINIYNNGIDYLKKFGFTESAIKLVTGASSATYYNWQSGVRHIPMTKIDKLLNTDLKVITRGGYL